MGWTGSVHGVRETFIQKFVRKLKRREHLSKLSVDGRIIL